MLIAWFGSLIPLAECTGSGPGAAVISGAESGSESGSRGGASGAGGGAVGFPISLMASASVVSVPRCTRML